MVLAVGTEPVNEIRASLASDTKRALLSARSLHDVQNTGRQAGDVSRIGKERTGQGRPLRRLQDAGVAGGERWPQLPGRQH